MSTLALAPSQFDGLGGEPTLDELIAGVWEGLAVHRVVECPVCEGEMVPRPGAHRDAAGGRCTGCGAELE
jgi:hypothetical protein